MICHGEFCQLISHRNSSTSWQPTISVFEQWNLLGIHSLSTPKSGAFRSILKHPLTQETPALQAVLHTNAFQS